MVNDRKDFDVLDMNNYKVERLPVRSKSTLEKWLTIIGFPLAILSFLLINFWVDIPFLSNIDSNSLSKDALARLNELGSEEFSRINFSMLAIFVAAVILWITEAVPNYLTSLILIIAMVLTGVVSETDA